MYEGVGLWSPAWWGDVLVRAFTRAMCLRLSDVAGVWYFGLVGALGLLWCFSCVALVFWCVGLVLTVTNLRVLGVGSGVVTVVVVSVVSVRVASAALVVTVLGMAGWGWGR